MAGANLLVPIRTFGGMTRLAGALSRQDRIALASHLAHGVVTAGLDAGLKVSVVTNDEKVIAWCGERSLRVIHDPGTLSGAARDAVDTLGTERWIVTHADLPLITSSALTLVDRSVSDGHVVLVPSTDGGTNVIGGVGAFPFNYGVGSFHRHFASVPSAHVVSLPQLSVDIDVPRDLAAICAS